jgi:hypothetical protein
VRISSGDGAGASSDPHGGSDALVFVPVTKNAFFPTFSALLTTPNCSCSRAAECTASRSATENSFLLQGTIWIVSAGL